MDRKKMFIIGGPNGAGKTTASMEYLKDDLDCLEFVNADNIAFGLSPFRPDNVAVTAGKIMLNRIDELIKSKENFAIESTLSSKSLLEKIKQAQLNDYDVILLFYYLDSPDLAVKRVARRVENGGHDIPIETIYRRYNRGLENFFKIYKDNCQYWIMINNSDTNTSIIAEGNIQNLIIHNQDIWLEIKEKYGKTI